MRLIAILLALLPAGGYCNHQYTPESMPRPSVKGYSTIKGVCESTSGLIAGQNFTGRAGTLKQCTKRCNSLEGCRGLNFVTDLQQCLLFNQECDQTIILNKTAPFQNFYLKGEISCSTSTVGTEFYLAFMSNRVAQPKNMSLEIWITQDHNINDVTVTVEIDPSMTSMWGSRSNTQKIRVPFKQAVSTLIPFTWKSTDVDSGVTIEKKVLKLSADSEFVFYGVNKEYFTADAFLGIPSRALGTRYVVNCHWPPYYNCEFAFAPTADDTTVKVTLPRLGATRNVGNWEKAPPRPNKCAIPYMGKTLTNGDSFVVNLGKFDLAQIQDPCDLTGAIISADKQIAVWSGDSRVNVGDSPSRDHLVEQLFSTDTWGTDCAAWPTPNRTTGLVDYWVITAATDGTKVRVDSSEKETIYHDLNDGESVRFPANSVKEWMRFSSDKKFQAVQYSHSAMDPKIPGDPSMTICIPSDQFGFGYTFVTPTGVSSTYTNYLTIITNDGTQTGFILNGNPLSAVTWSKVPNSNLVGGYVRLDTSSKQQFRIEHTNKAITFEAYIYGAGDRESIGYPTGACIKALGECSTSKMFIGDGKDNDCDGVIDEELFDNIDNDFDGMIDEDCYALKPLPEDRCPKILNATACYGGQLVLACDEGTIGIVDAHLGRISRANEITCASENALDSCSSSEVNCGFADISTVMLIQCNGHAQCVQPVNYLALGNIMAPSKCPTCSLYAQVQYFCMNSREQGYTSLTGSNYVASSWLSASSSGSSCPSSASSSGVSYLSAACPSCSTVIDKPIDNYHPSQAAFDTNNARGWRPAVCDKDSSWLQVDVGAHYNITWYAIAGCRKEDYWVTQFGISYSVDGNKWTDIREANGALKKFDGNTDASSVYVCTIFSYNIVARWVRIFPLAYNGYPCVHIDFGHNDTIQGCRAQAVANTNFAKGGTTGLNSTVNVTCSKGWATETGEVSYQVQCGADGQWVGTFRPCTNVLFCPDIPHVDGGYAIAKNTLIGSKIDYACLTGRRLRGAATLTCLDNGKWSADAPMCEQL